MNMIQYSHGVFVESGNVSNRVTDPVAEHDPTDLVNPFTKEDPVPEPKESVAKSTKSDKTEKVEVAAKEDAQKA